MPCGTCETDPCVCSRVIPVVRSTVRPRPVDVMTKEEFGLDLYAVMVRIGGILGLQEQYAGHVNRGDKAKLAETLAKRDRLKRELLPLMEQLSDADAAEVVRRYPWVLQTVSA